MPHRHPPGRRWRALLAALAVAIIGSAAVVAAPAGPAWACPTTGCPTPPPPPPVDDDPPPPTPRPIHIVIMGDSYTSGEGMGMGIYPTVPGSNPPQVDWRHQSAYAPAMLAWMYLEMARKPLLSSYTVNSLTLQTSWGLDHADFVASSGATTADITQPQLDQDTHQQRSAPQGDVLNSGTDLVYFGFGGNDAHFAQLFETAVKYYAIGKAAEANNRPGLPQVTWQGVQTQEVAAKVTQLLAGMAQVTTNVENALTTTWQKAPDAQIVVALYPQGLKPSGNATIPFIAGSSLDQMYAFGQAVNNAIRAAVTRFQQDHPTAPQIHVFDPNTAGPGGTSVVAGHELGQQGSYFNPLVANSVELMRGNMLHGLQESFHPNQFGGVAIGTALANFLHAQLPSLWPNPPDFTDVHTSPNAYADNPQQDAAFDAWASANLGQLCAGVTDASVCAAPPAGGGGSGGDPDNGGYVNPADPNAGLLAWLLDVWDAQLANASSSGSSSGGSGSSGSGGKLDYYVMLEGHWCHIWTDDNGVVHQDPMPDGFQPDPSKVLPNPAQDSTQDPDDPGDDDGYGDPGDDGGYGDPGDDGGYGDPGDDGGYGDPGDGDGGYGDGGDGGGYGDGGGGGYGDGGGGGDCDAQNVSRPRSGSLQPVLQLAAFRIGAMAPALREPCDPDYPEL